MPQYISLAQQGFWEPYQQLAQNMARYQDRQTHKQERQQDISQRGFENEQTVAANKRADKLANMNLDTSALALQEGRDKFEQDKALRNLDLNSFNTPDQPVPSSSYGLPVLPTKGTHVDLRVPFMAQPPEVQQKVVAYAHQNKLSVPQAVAAFQQQQTALTGVVPPMILPNGFTPTKYKLGKDGPEMEAYNTAATGSASAQAPAGQQWVTNPQTGEVSLVKSDNPAPDELLRLQSLDTLDQQLKLAEENAAKVSPILGASSSVPLWGRFQRGMTWLAKPDTYNAMRAYDANRAALPMDIWRGVMGANTRINEDSMSEIQHMIPSLSDPINTRQALFGQLHRQIAEARKSAVDTAQRGGKEMKGFNTLDYLKNGGNAPTGHEPGQQAPATLNFETEAAALAANLPKGTRIGIKNPVTGKYKPATIQ